MAFPAYESQFQVWLYPKGMDPGHPVTFPLIHALLWKVFGPHLWISHLFNFGFVLVSLFLSRYIDRLYQCKGWFLVLVAANPLFIAIAASLNTHIILVAFFLGFHVYQSRKNIWGQLICLSGLLLTHNQGMLLAVVLLIADLIVNKNVVKTTKLLLGFIPWAVWLIIHKSQTGWYLFPPEYAEFRGIGTFQMLIKNAAIIIWRISDFGLFIIWIIAIPFLFKNRNRKMTQIVLIALGAIGSVWLSVKFSIAHRYLFFALLIISIPAGIKLQQLRRRYQIPIIILLISGSFWYYPGKQLSDANIQYRHYFSIYSQIQNQKELENRMIYSTPPNESASHITHLSHDSNWLKIASVSEEKNTNRIHFVMNGNVCGPLPYDLDSAVQTWDVITVKSGPAWVNLYSKSRFADHLHSRFPQRETSWLESKIKTLKKDLK